MSRLTVVYDSCVLYPAPLRSLLMYLATTGLYRARWSDDIHEEWMRSFQCDYPDISRRQAERIRDLMDAHVDDCIVSGYEALIPTLNLPDPDDRHVLAAAIHSGADLIVTFNLKDFPAHTLAPHAIEAQHPDDFLTQQLEIAPTVVCQAANEHRRGLKNPPMGVEAYLASLERQGLVRTVSALQEYADII